MIKILEEADKKKKAKGGRRNKLSMEKQLLMALEYIREYRTYFHVSYLYSVFQYGLNHLRCIANDVLRWISGAKLRKNYSINSMDYALVAKK